VKATAQAISTARGVALLRAAEAQRPPAERICADPYARSFVNPVTLLAIGPIIRMGLPDRLFLGGAMSFAIAREQYIHDLIVAEARAGLEQLVILGAGFDTRAYRIPELAEVPVFEVDHPVTQAAKRKAIAGVVEPFPANVNFVAVDFDRDALGDRLAASGYDASRRTLFVWQGVTMYLTPEGVYRTLGFVATHSAPGSAIVFDYLYSGVLSGSKTLGMRLVTRAMGEHMTFGIDGARIAAFLEHRGFTAIRNVDGAELKRLYLTGPNAARPITLDAAIVSARVAGAD